LPTFLKSFVFVIKTEIPIAIQTKMTAAQKLGSWVIVYVSHVYMLSETRGYVQEGEAKMFTKSVKKCVYT